jgi:hypothetical protein
MCGVCRILEETAVSESATAERLLAQAKDHGVRLRYGAARSAG